MRAVRLFGSAARGDWSEESDIDVLVLLDEVADADSEWIVGRAYRLGLIENRTLLQPAILSERDFRHLAARERLFAREIEKEGIDL